jgi:cellulose synthase/poly-beta-1,6-N-acetylglucosamine synthase-like glycosyltransferase
MLTFILLYSFVQLSMLRSYRKKVKPENISPDYFPLVTIQLPVYNEKFVVERLIDSICKLEYPQEKLHIQILDDSTDETSEIISQAIKNWKAKGLNIEHIQRTERVGYKAGALAYGTKTALGEYIAIFDADFVPNSDFLLEVIPHFQDKKVGVVQTRWGHLNKEYSLLTKLQAFGLDAHFTVEQTGRMKGNHFLNFNGTAGVWRKETIENAGGWQHDTLTEDLDLSYRAQAKGWQFIFLEDHCTPAELPANILPLKTQQFRWTKGAAECFKKNLKLVFKSDLPLSTKLHAFFHLSNSFLFVAILISAICSVPMLFAKTQFPQFNFLFNLGSIFLLSFVTLILVYSHSYKKIHGNYKEFYFLFPLFLAVSMGLSFHNSIAVIEGYLGKKTPFLRTPKQCSVGIDLSRKKLKHYVKSSFTIIQLFELFLFFYFLLAIAFGIREKEFALLPFHIMLCFGFGFVSISAIRSTFQLQRNVA